jgi:hypothetical protein
MSYDDTNVYDQSFGVATKLNISDGSLFPVDGILGINHLDFMAYENDGEPAAPIDNILHPYMYKNVTVFLDK